MGGFEFCLPCGYVVLKEDSDCIIVGIIEMDLIADKSPGCFVYHGQFYFRGPLVPTPEGASGNYFACRLYRK